MHVDVRRVEQPVGVFLEAEDRGAGRSCRRARPRTRQAVVQRVGQHVGGRVAPGHELAVVPDEAVTVGHGHGGISSVAVNECLAGALKCAMNRVWKPNVTVAALIEREGRFLLVEEETDDGVCASTSPPDTSTRASR
jgi:hypothetical protein